MKEQIRLETIGGDFEVFLRNRETGEIVSSEGITKGSKYDPFRFDVDNEFFTTSLDNVLTEFTIPPAREESDWVAYLNKSIAYVRSFIPSELDIYPVPSANLDEKYLKTEQARVFGCEPDFNAYTMAQNEKPKADDHTLRSAGGHIHVGYSGIETPFKGSMYRYSVDEQRSNIVKVMDLFIGVPSILLEPDNKRKELYGKAGAFRPKPYGLEYRTVSNFYLANNDLKKWVFNATKEAFKYISEVGFLQKGESDFIREAINNNNKEAAKQLIEEFKLQLV